MGEPDSVATGPRTVAAPASGAQWGLGVEKLAVLQMELEEQRRRELDMERMPEPEPERKANPDSRAASRQQADLAAEAEMDAQRGMMSSPAPSALQHPRYPFNTHSEHF